jgi:tetratricopeptide (TPR) repeat protein
MRSKRLLLAVLLLSLSGITATGQDSHSEARERIRQGNEMYARAEYEVAIREYRRVPEKAGEVYAQSLYNIGVCYYELQRTEEAIKMYRSAVGASRERYPKALYALGVALEDSRRWPEAKEAYREAVITSSGSYTESQLAVAHYRLGLLALREDDYEGADALFREAIARSGQAFPASHNNLGVALALAGRLEMAEQEFAVALRQSRGAFGEAAHNLKLCRSRLTMWTKAQFASLKVVETITPAIEAN